MAPAISLPPLMSATGAVFAHCYQRHTNLEFRHFLRALRARAPDSRWHLIVDNAGFHKKQEVPDWCAAHRLSVEELLAFIGRVLAIVRVSPRRRK